MMASKLFGVVLLSSLFLHGAAQARPAHEFSLEVEDNLKTGENFSLEIQADGTFWHRGGKILAGFRQYKADGKKCGDLILKGNGHIFKEFKEDLEEWAKHEHYKILADFFRRRNHLELINVKLCYPLPPPEEGSTVDDKDQDVVIDMTPQSGPKTEPTPEPKAEPAE